jgi:histidinol-phosphate aminotransferase
MFDLNTILRPHIISLTPYSSARDEYTGKEGIFPGCQRKCVRIDARRFGFRRQFTTVILIRTNWRLKPNWLRSKGVRPSQIFIGNGSDEPIDLLVRATCTPGHDSMLIMPPTYGMYEVSAAINDVQLIKVPLTLDFQVDIPAVLAAVQPQTKLLFVCSPNNPTGNLINQNDILTLLTSFHGLVVVDEAYIDFADTQSFTNLLDQYPNLVVLQTFSKAWGIGGIAVGHVLCFGSIDRGAE